MSDIIKHECGIALIRLLKPLDYYIEKYGTPLYGLNKLYLLMEKQHNRGQDGAGVATIKLDMPPGQRYISRYRDNGQQPIHAIFGKIHKKFEKINRKRPDLMKDPQWLKENVGFTGELLLGHLRYGTHGKNSIESCHPFLRQNNWMTRNLVLAGNFNVTNNDELFRQLIALGQHPKENADTVTMLEKIGHFLDEENDEMVAKYKAEGKSNIEITSLIQDNLNVENVLKRSMKGVDGGFVMAGLIGHGDAFVLRDPSSIRPAYYYQDDEVMVVTSERPPIQTAFNVPFEEIKEIPGGSALIIKKNGEIKTVQYKEPRERLACSFERIYFSRGSDAEIYKERKMLGSLMVPQILNAIDGDVPNTVFSFIPNTAETSFYGMVEGLNDHTKQYRAEKLLELNGKLTPENVDKILSFRPRVEKMAIKDVKMRTFITDDTHRKDMVANVYDTTYGVLKRGEDNLVVIDDSIVRGTTLKQSILKILDRLGPKKIVVASSAPQIRYPDCYGIDMSKMGDFVAFQAAVQLLHERNQEDILDKAYALCKEDENKPVEDIVNHVKLVYEPFTDQEISDRISKIVKAPEVKAEVIIVYQTIENLHKACPLNKGDWYFSGDFPTPGGNRVANRAFMNYMEGKNARAY